MKFTTSWCGATAALALLATTASAQTITAVVLEGQSVTGVGDVTRIDNLDVNNNGAWLVEVDTNGSDTLLDGAVLDSSGGVFQEGDALVVPGFPMAVHDSWDSVRLNNLGATCWNHSIDNTAGSSDDTGVFWNSTLVIQESTDTTPISGLPGPNPWTGFFEVNINDLNQLLILGSVNEPTIGTSTTDRHLVRVTLDGSGAIINSTIIAREDDILAGMGTGRLDDVETGSNDTRLNNNGDVIFVADVDTPVNGDKIVYTWIGGVHTLIAEEGTPTFFDAGRNWDFLTRGVDINDDGDIVYIGNLDGATTDDELIATRIGGVDAVFKREGDTFPAISPFVLNGTSAVGGSSSNVWIDNNGDITWAGSWDDVSTQNTGIFRNETLVAQEGVTILHAGLFASTLTSGSDKLAVSDNGRYILFEATLSDGTDGAFLVDMLGTQNLGSLCTGDGGDQMGCTDCPCSNNAMVGSGGGCLNSAGTGSRLIASGSPSVSLPMGSSADLRFEATDGPASQLFVLNAGDAIAPDNPANPCFGLDTGLAGATFDGLRCAIQNTTRNGGRGADVNGDVGMTNAGWGGADNPPGGIAVFFGYSSGQTRYFQAIHRDDPAVNCGTGLNTTQAVCVTFTP